MQDAFSTSFIAALMLIVAIVGGYIAKWVRIPRIVALIVGGVGLKYLVGSYVSPETTRSLVVPLRFVNEIALGLILFIIGGVFEVSRLKSTGRQLWRFSSAEIGLTAFLTAIGCTIAAWFLPGVDIGSSLVVGALLASVAVATAPAATWYVLHEYDAKGPNTDHILLMTGINNMVSIIAFHVFFIIFIALGLIHGIQGPTRSWWLDLFFVSIGSIGLGIFLGLLLSVVHARLPLREMVLMFFATLSLLSAGDTWMLHVLGTAFYPMITFLVTGVVFANRARDTAPFENTLETISLPIFSIFFVLAGYNLHLEELPHLGVLGLAYLAMRTTGKYIGVKKTVQKLGDSIKVKENAGLGLLCQAGVAVFLGAFLLEHWSNPLAVKINTVILASVAICELVGPLLVKHVVITGGEVKAVTLIRPGFLRRTWIAPPPLGLPKWPKTPGQTTSSKEDSRPPLSVKHMMRSNINFLPVTATFDEVLEFIERSRFHDFPVVDSNGCYAGMVHFNKVRDRIYNPALIKLVTARVLADTETPVVTPDTEPAELLELFHKHNLGEIAVVEDRLTRKLIGLIEQRDLLREMYKK
jgi:Kef-type K+ transport system membrane component KefB/predicted transcriptional regulator